MSPNLSPLSSPSLSVSPMCNYSTNNAVREHFVFFVLLLEFYLLLHKTTDYCFTHAYIYIYSQVFFKNPQIQNTLHYTATALKVSQVLINLCAVCRYELFFSLLVLYFMKLSAYSNLTPQESKRKKFTTALNCSITCARYLSRFRIHPKIGGWNGDIILAALVYSFEALSRHK
jgi:hypothetical protein